VEVDSQRRDEEDSGEREAARMALRLRSDGAGVLLNNAGATGPDSRMQHSEGLGLCVCVCVCFLNSFIISLF